ncbi:MAG TPA: GTP cyclohydrolase MptA [Solirubrobacterales bacterium]|nr:GTP cyclohydrolase MptA [Solirubrobacterales bacterium]
MAPRTAPLPTITQDVQSGRPATEVSLSRVGVTGVEKVIRVQSEAGEHLYLAELECFVDLNPQQAGVHMSRFEEVVGEAIDSVVLGESSFRAETLAAHIAEQVRESQQGFRAEVSVTAHYPETVTTPESGQRTQELYTLLGTAVCSERGTRTLTGVQAQGMTACPCAQGMVAEVARDRLAAQGFDEEQIDLALAAVPVATHNQRGIGTLWVGCPEGNAIDVDARDLLRIVESSMSSEIYELMKRPDELAVVAKAHANPRFVEDCVREMIRQVAASFGEMDENAFVMARQENLETIHRHNVVAERHGLLGDLLGELETGEHQLHHVSMREWLEAPRP